MTPQTSLCPRLESQPALCFARPFAELSTVGGREAPEAEYGDSGVMTFIVNQDGIVYEKDLGDDTMKIASQIKEYNPDESWSPVESPE